MPRNMSFQLTKQAVRDRTKDVTRRRGWKNLKPGELFWAVEQAMGLKPGEKMVRLALCRCKSNTPEQLDDLANISPDECRREGFPHLTPAEFAAMFYRDVGHERGETINRIEFEYVMPQPTHFTAEAAKTYRKQDEGGSSPRRAQRTRR